MENSLDKLVKAMKSAARVNDGSLKDEFLQVVLSDAAEVLRKRVDYHTAVALRVDNWLPACNGTETPFNTRSGRRLLYCWNPATGQHAYIDLQTDMALSNDEAQTLLHGPYA